MRRRVQRVLAFAWRWSWIPAAALIAVTVVFTRGVYEHFVTFGIERDVRPYRVRLGQLGNHALVRTARRVRSSVAPPALSDQHALRTLELDIGAAGIAELDADLPYSGREYQSATLTCGGTTRSVDVRYRGDTYVHWGGARKSIRVRTPKDDLFDGMRRFNLVVAKTPAHLNNFLSSRLASMLGLLAPRVELVRVVVDGDDRGIHVLTEQIDESTLRANRRMPGAIFEGELIGRDAWRGLPNRLFDRAGLWEEEEKLDGPRAVRREPIDRLIAVVSAPRDASTARRLAELVDMDAFARWAVLEQLTQSHHFDHFHNWKLYWDPWLQRFQPIAWDVVGWQVSMRPAAGAPIDLHPVFTPLHAALHTSVAFLAARDRAVEDFFDGGGAARLLEELARAEDLLDANLPQDAFRPVDDRRTAAARSAFRDFVVRCVQELRDTWHRPHPVLAWRPRTPDGEDGALLLCIGSDRPVRSVALHFPTAVEPRRVTVRIRRSDGVESIDAGALWRVDGRRVVVDVPIASALEPRFTFRGGSPARNHRLVPVPTCFEIELAGVDVRRVERVVADERQDFARDPTLTASLAGEICFGFEPPPREATLLTGEVVVEQVRVFDGVVRIAAGTTVRLAPGAALIFRNRVVADGSPAAPIRFVPDDGSPGSAPWGTIALVGPRASESRLSNCEIVGGGGLATGGWPFTGIISIHGADRVEVADCRLRDNLAPVDVIHVVHAGVAFDRLTLDGAVEDGVDCDLSRVCVFDSRITGCGNDALDFMDSTAAVFGSRFERNGDKGISIGELSRVAVADVLLGRCAIGLEVRDGSAVTAMHCELAQCGVGVRAAEKEWRYGAGGDVTVIGSWFHGDGEAAAAAGRSRIRITRCRLPRPSAAGDGPVAFLDCGPDAVPGADPVPCPTGLFALPAPIEDRWRRSQAAVVGRPGR